MTRTIDAPVSFWGDTELVEERTSALTRSAERLERLLSEMTGLEQDLERVDLTLGLPGIDPDAAAGLQHELDLAIEAYNHVREAAASCYHRLILQREALGFRVHDAVERCYPIPDMILPPEEYEELEQLDP